MQGWVSETGGDGDTGRKRDEVGKGRKTILKTQPGEQEPASSASWAPPVLQGAPLLWVSVADAPTPQVTLVHTETIAIYLLVLSSLEFPQTHLLPFPT